MFLHFRGAHEMDGIRFIKILVIIVSFNNHLFSVRNSHGCCFCELTVQEGFVGDKLQCMGCKARLGTFNWAGMQCNCGTWINPAFQLHKNRLDECVL